MFGFGKKEPKTLAELSEGRPQLLSGEWTLCAHKRFGFSSSAQVSDDTGTYLRIVGDCRDCKKTVEAIRDIPTRNLQMS